MKVKRKIGNKVCVLAFFLYLCVLLMSYIISDKIINNREVFSNSRVEAYLNTALNDLGHDFKTEQEKLKWLSFYVASTGFNQKSFLLASDELLDGVKGSSNFQFAPNGVVTVTNPHVSDKRAYIDLFSDQNRKEDALYAKKHRTMYVSGPLNLYQGGLAFILRNPVFSLHRTHKFLGFVIYVSDISDSKIFSRISELSQYGYTVSLTTQYKQQAKIQILSTVDLKKDHYLFSINKTFYNSTWTMKIYSSNKMNDYQDLVLYITLLIDICIGIGLLLTIKFFEHYKNIHNERLLDHLTGLGNRKALELELSREFESKQDFSFVYIDLNDFKFVNDTYGHEIGDSLLRQFSARLNRYIWSHNLGMAFRVGGDEFNLIVAAKFDEESIRRGLDDLCKLPFQLDDVLYNLTISCGYAKRYPSDETLEQVIRRADDDMYRMKAIKKRPMTDAFSNTI
ncbi:sensor domain-containing diguanylate cyclase [Photobacterium damselae]|uniref:diguanylate cyclase n=2 Tax=Photobacterium damselae TaxID=38293 RepID=A0AAD3WY88_PHODD|nr:sensor domain-containing diguanylate cyclase [Photobacterium damselae]KAB1180536.1 sensor domain-containing diguanylate cyclase [Photobacterium damselae subsp. damselae]